MTIADIEEANKLVASLQTGVKTLQEAQAECISGLLDCLNDYQEFLLKSIKELQND